MNHVARQFASAEEDAGGLKRLMTRLKLACVQPANEPKQTTDAAWAMILECIAVEKLTPAEIERGYRETIRRVPTYRPRYGEWLQACRPAMSEAAVKVQAQGEAETILTLIIDHPLKYGTYSPEVGTVYERRKIEAQHGRAAGEAFGAIASRISTMETLADRKWLSITFCEAYEAAREAYGAPAALTPPSRQIAAHKPAGELTGVTQEDAAAEAARLVFVQTIHGIPPVSVPVDFEARKRELAKQAEELQAGIAPEPKPIPEAVAS